MKRRMVAGRQADLWLLESTLTVEHADEPLSAYEVSHGAGSSGARGRSGRLLEVKRPTLFKTSYASDQSRLFGLADALQDAGLRGCSG